MNDNEFKRRMDNILFPTLPYQSIQKDYTDSENVNAEICAECGGVCCKTCGCHFSPDDFPEISFEYLKKELEKGYISIDYVDREVIYDDINIFILRVRNQNAPIVDMGYRRTPCILLTENGCKLDYDNRPAGGKLLIPKESFPTLFGETRRCHCKYDIDDCCYEWKPHQKVLYRLAKYFEGKEIPCSL